MSDKEAKRESTENQENIEKAKDVQQNMPAPGSDTEEMEKQATDAQTKASATSDHNSEPEQDSDKINDELDETLAEENEDEDLQKRHDIEMKDYHAMTMNELVMELDELLKSEKIQTIRDHVQEIKLEFDSKFDEEMEQKKEDFLEEGGNIIDFHYSSPTKKRFNEVYFKYKEQRNKHYEELKKNLNQNLKERLAIIEELKGMIGDSADMNNSFATFKQLQERWKKAGPVPREDYKDIWRTYHHHVEVFYDFLHLDREFRDLDFKHNLDQKLKMIARAEELTQETNINRAFRELQMLHKMWKEEVGPVAKEYREDIWERFSAATKKIHENRQAYFEELDKAREKNLEKKNEIIDSIKNIAQEEITSHKQAQANIKKIESLRNEFFKAGKVPKKNAEESWKRFKENVRSFNRKKNAFYKNLKKEQYENLSKKLELVQIAEENKDNLEFKITTPIMKRIQSEWKKIGHVPRKDSDKIWKRFKKACNHYFNRLHEKQNEENKDEMQAFEKKKELLEKVKNLTLPQDHQEALKLIKEQINIWKDLGHVPFKMKYIEGKFNKALDQLFKQLDISKRESELLKYENKLQSLDQADGADKFRKEEFFIRKRIEETDQEIIQLENNMQFFSNADESNPLVKEVLKNIERKKQELGTWEAKLKKLTNIDN